MKLLLLLGSLVFLGASKTCKPKTASSAISGHCFKGRLEIKAACMNYTISVLSGGIDTSLVEASWTDETTGKAYKNAFALGSPCTFPSRLNAGDEFYFTVDTGARQNCAVCMIYYPVPRRHLRIKVLDKPCE